MITTEKKPQGTARLADITVANEGSILLFTAHTQRGKEWMHAHIPSDATFFAGSLVVEPRYALDLAVGMTNDRLKVR
jgi:hypothetical protein